MTNLDASASPLITQKISSTDLRSLCNDCLVHTTILREFILSKDQAELNRKGFTSVRLLETLQIELQSLFTGCLLAKQKEHLSAPLEQICRDGLALRGEILGLMGGLSLWHSPRPEDHKDVHLWFAHHVQAMHCAAKAEVFLLSVVGYADQISIVTRGPTVSLG